MPTPTELVEAQAMKLTPTERADLADKLWLSVHSKEEVHAAWEVEIARRIAEMDAGEVQGIPWETVMAEARAKLR
jgi:putative addiction module component (TIGR02574 family)